jgi:hypothetical protein
VASYRRRNGPQSALAAPSWCAPTRQPPVLFEVALPQPDGLWRLRHNTALSSFARSMLGCFRLDLLQGFDGRDVVAELDGLRALAEFGLVGDAIIDRRDAGRLLRLYLWSSPIADTPRRCGAVCRR